MATGNNANIGFEKQIWDAACVLWGHIPAAEYRKVIVGLIFLRYISSAFEKRYQELVTEGDGFEDDKDAYAEDNIFFVPEDARWSKIASRAHTPEIGMRTLPLVPFMRERLLALKEEQKENRRLCGRSYIKDYLDYVCVNEIGDLIKPHYVTTAFPDLLKANGMRHIRYHDLRHSCASLLLANGVPMKQIQEWLGHSDFSTTANIYAHLDYSSKLTSADAMLNGLGLVPN